MTTSTVETRATNLAKITGGKPEWYNTRKQLTAAERNAGVVWDGNAGEYAYASENIYPTRTKSGSWGYQPHGSNSHVALTRAECVERGLEPGPANQ